MWRRISVFVLALCMISLVAQADHATLFKLRIENVSTDSILKSKAGESAAAGLSPGVVILYNGSSHPFFMPGKMVMGEGLERLAEDGNPAPLAEMSRKDKGVMLVQVFNTPVGMDQPGPIGPGGAYEVTFTAHPGARLMLAQMFGQSNDLFYAPDPKGIELFDKDGTAMAGNLTQYIRLWDAGTEVNQEPGFGADQAPRQKEPNTGMEEHGSVNMVKDAFTYPMVSQVLKITLTHQ